MVSGGATFHARLRLLFAAIRRRMNTGLRTRFIQATLAVLCCSLAIAQEPSKQNLDRQYRAAVADYEAGSYPQAAAQLEKLLTYAPRSYELHELLGMVY